MMRVAQTSVYVVQLSLSYDSNRDGRLAVNFLFKSFTEFSKSKPVLEQKEGVQVSSRGKSNDGEADAGIENVVSFLDLENLPDQSSSSRMDNWFDRCFSHVATTTIVSTPTAEIDLSCEKKEVFSSGKEIEAEGRGDGGEGMEDIH
jgi:hypothetical protein